MSKKRDDYSEDELAREGKDATTPEGDVLLDKYHGYSPDQVLKMEGSRNEGPPDLGDGANIPRITGVDPAGCSVTDDPISMVVSGMNIPASATVTFGGVELPTTFVSDTELTAELDPSVGEPGGYPVTIKVGGLEAQPAVMFTVTEAASRKGKR